jgi:hypothetical protein
MSDPVLNPTRTTLSILPADKRAYYLERCTHWKDIVVKLEAALDALLTDPDTGAALTLESYSYAGGNGQQSGKKRSPEEISRSIAAAEKQYGYYYSKLYGGGNVNMSLRRRR